MRDTKDTINSYITDMLSLEEHVDKAVTGQIEDLKDDDPQVVAELKTVQSWVQHHVSDLKQRSEARQAATPTDAVKRAGWQHGAGSKPDHERTTQRTTWRGKVTNMTLPRRNTRGVKR
jgi:hypothetical protein